MSIRTRLALGIVAIAVVLAVPLLIALRSLERLHDETSQLNDREFAASLMLGRMRAATEDLRRSETAVVVDPRDSTRAMMAADIDRLKNLSDSLSSFALDSAAHYVNRAVREVGAHAQPQYEAAIAGRTAVVDSISTGTMLPALARIEGAIVAAERSLIARTRDRVQIASQATEQAWETSAVMLVLAAILVAGIAIWLTWSIGGPVRELETGMRRVADGDLSYRLPFRSDRPDEFGQLAESFSTMSEQLAEVDRIKAEFMSVASHELKTPINVIIGYLQLLDEGIYGPLTPKQLEICRTIRAQGNSLARLVQQLLDVSRFQAGAGRIELRPVGLTKFLTELEAAFHVLARQRGIGFRVVHGDGLPETVLWDPDRMNEVLGNLLSNAFKFTERGGRVELAVERLDGSMQLDVRDSGAGIPPDELEHVFEKFYQADNQSRASQAGTGLGLAIAKQIVEAHHGTIHCDSTVGEGTTFTIVIPISASTPDSTPRPQLATSETT